MDRSRWATLAVVALMTIAGCLERQGAHNAPSSADVRPASSDVAEETPPTTDAPSTPTPPDPTQDPSPRAPPGPDDDNDTTSTPPVAAATVTSTSPNLHVQGNDVYFEVKAPLRLDARGSTGTNLTFEWDLGDGARSDKAVVERTYLRFGDYLVLLRITDGEGRNATHRLLLHAAPPMAPPGDLAVVKTFTGSWQQHVNPADQKPITSTHEFVVPYPTARLDVRVTWATGPAPGRSVPLSELEAQIYDLEGRKAASQRSTDGLHVVLTGDTLVAGYWRLDLVPHRAPGAAYEATIVAWTQPPTVLTLSGAFGDPPDAPSSLVHRVPVYSTVSTVWADLRWDGPDPGDVPCQEGDRALGHLGLRVAVASTTVLSSDHPLACESSLADRGPHEFISDPAEWTFTVSASPGAVRTAYTLTVAYL